MSQYDFIKWAGKIDEMSEGDFKVEKVGFDGIGICHIMIGDIAEGHIQIYFKEEVEDVVQMKFNNKYTHMIIKPGNISLLDIMTCCEDLFDLNCSSNGIDSKTIPYKKRSFFIMCNGNEFQEHIRDLFREFITESNDNFEAHIPGSGVYHYVGGCSDNYDSYPHIVFQCNIKNE